MNARGEQVDEAIAWLCEAVDANVGTGARPRRLAKREQRDAVAMVDRINRAVHPRRLPADIEWFWIRWDPASFEYLDPFASMAMPSFCLESWERDPKWPRALFWVAYEHHNFLAVELEYPDAEASQLFADSYDTNSGLSLIAPNLAMRLSACAAAIEQHPNVEPLTLWSTGAVGEVQQLCDDALLVNGIVPDARGPHDWYDILTCPPRWQRQQGVTPEVATPRGRTYTIADLHEAREHGPVEATIVGHAHTRAGTGGGRLMVVSDETGEAFVWVPTSVPSVGDPRGGHMEIDVIARPPSGHETAIPEFDDDHADASRRGLAGDIAGAAEVGARMGGFIGGDHSIVARALRPLD
ncbi:MAG: hypothetical protein AAF467_16510 [Actinomycetota bacterium]